MTETPDHATTPQSQQPEKRQRPRVTKACRACRKRKTSCSGEVPCKRCREEGIECDYNVVDGRTTKKQKTQHRKASGVRSRPPNTDEGRQEIQETAGLDSRDSVGPVFDDQQHTGAASGLAFLHEAVQRIEKQTSSSLRRKEYPVQASTSIFTSGDMPFEIGDLANLELPDQERSRSLLSRYFDFATPSYRFFHRPTVETWAEQLLTDPDGKDALLSASQKAIIFLLWAQALEYRGEGTNNSTSSHFFYAKARSLIDSEPGPPTLESVQVRLALCLYLLSTSRINECWYTFGVTTFIVMALGLHRNNSQYNSIGLIESECRKRAFWSSYTLDRYLSVMKGRPRIFRDNDIDQEYPANVSDSDMIFTDVNMLSHLPQHGLMETTINHAKLACIMGRATDLLYPLRPPNEADLLQRAETMVRELDAWEADLPLFLKPSTQTLTGQRIFERQNSVMKLAHAHVRIMITRLFIVGNFAALGQQQGSDDSNTVAHSHLASCLQATYTIIDTVDAFVSSNTLIRGFWFTQYISLCAISTLYIYVIHNHIDPSSLTLPNGKNYFSIAERCQQYLTSKAPANSPNQRYLVLLSQLRKKARRGFPRAGNPPESRTTTAETMNEDRNVYMTLPLEQTQTENSGDPVTATNVPFPLDNTNIQDFGFDDEFGMGSVTNSESVAEFDALPLSWGYLDQLALPETYDYLQLPNSQF
ncbi:fungal-specific transcription factor domain-containing protein [Halenospora varia]|nr:fungal-specific transcription factor domain-containing protein [Halenospora varia]